MWLVSELSGDTVIEGDGKISRNATNSWTSLMIRLNHLFPFPAKTVAERKAEVLQTETALSNSSHIEIEVLKSLLKFEAPLLGEIGAIRPIRPAGEKGFKRSTHSR